MGEGKLPSFTQRSSVAFGIDVRSITCCLVNRFTSVSKLGCLVPDFHRPLRGGQRVQHKTMKLIPPTLARVATRRRNQKSYILEEVGVNGSPSSVIFR